MLFQNPGLSDFRSHPVKPEAQHLIAKMHFSLCGSAILKAVYTPGGKLQKLLPKGFAPTPCSAGPISGQQAAAAPEIQLPIFGTCPPSAGGDHWLPAPTQREPGSLPGWYFDILTVNTPSRWHSVQLVRDVNEVPQKECRKSNLMRGMTANPEKRRHRDLRCSSFTLSLPHSVFVLLKVGR